MDERNLHVGHRERLIEKFLSYPKSLTDHELIELLLFFSIPRVDTNGISHKLFNTFNNLEYLLNAPITSLESIEGVGNKSAVLISLVNELTQRVKESQVKQKEFINFKDFGDMVISYFENNKSIEECVVFLFDKNHKYIASVCLENGGISNVNLDVKALTESFLRYKPSYLVLAHNHPSGILTPSKEDDEATLKISLLCKLHGVRLLDHMIVYGRNIYSYFREDRLKNSYDENQIKNFIVSIKE